MNVGLNNTFSVQSRSPKFMSIDRAHRLRILTNEVKQKLSTTKIVDRVISYYSITQVTKTTTVKHDNNLPVAVSTVFSREEGCQFAHQCYIVTSFLSFYFGIS